MIYFLLQLYIPCTLIVFLSWVGLWLNREATNDRINLGMKGAQLTETLFSLSLRSDHGSHLDLHYHRG